MVYVVPLAYVVRRPFTANGKQFARGATLTVDEARGVNLGLLSSGGFLSPAPDVHHRRPVRAPQPTYIAPGAYPVPIGDLVAGSVTAEPVVDEPLRIRFTADFDGPTRWDFGDGSVDVQDDAHCIHGYSTTGTYDVLVTSDSHTASTQVVLVPGRSQDSEPNSAGEDAVAPEAPAEPRRSRGRRTTAASVEQEPGEPAP